MHEGSKPGSSVATLPVSHSGAGGEQVPSVHHQQQVPAGSKALAETGTLHNVIRAKNQRGQRERAEAAADTTPPTDAAEPGPLTDVDNTLAYLGPHHSHVTERDADTSELSSKSLLHNLPSSVKAAVAAVTKQHETAADAMSDEDVDAARRGNRDMARAMTQINMRKNPLDALKLLQNYNPVHSVSRKTAQLAKNLARRGQRVTGDGPMLGKSCLSTAVQGSTVAVPKLTGGQIRRLAAGRLEPRRSMEELMPLNGRPVTQLQDEQFWQKACGPNGGPLN